jgi:CHAT domain-containing protein/tetratricopeptide (TPR) repeat protein
LLLDIGIIYQTIGNYDRAIESYQQALTIAREIQSSPIEAKALNNLGWAYQALGDNAKAIEYYQQSLILLQKLQEPQLQRIVLTNLGNTYYALREYTKTIEYYQQALPIARELQEPQSETAILVILGDAYNSSGDYQKAIEFAQEGLTIARSIKNPQLEALALVTLGSAGNSLAKSPEDYQKAIEFTQEGLTIAQDIKNPQLEAFALVTLGNAYTFLNDYQQALALSQQALTIARKLENPELEARALFTLAGVYQALEDFEKVVELAQQGLVIARNTKNRELEATALIVIGDTYDTISDYQKAVELIQQGLVIAKELQNQVLEAQALITLASAYDSLENYQQALEIAEQGLGLARELHNRDLEAKALDTIGNVYYSLNEYQKALEFVQQSLGIAQEINSPVGEMQARLTLALIYLDLGDYEKFTDQAQQSLTIARQIKESPVFEATSLLFLAVNYFAQGDNEQTIAFSEQALESLSSFKTRELVGAFQMPTLLLQSVGYGGLGNYEKAFELARESLEIARERQDRELEGYALNALGSLYSKSGQQEEAIATYQEALVVTEESQIAGRQIPVYAGLARVYRDLDRPVTAIAYYKQAIDDIEQIRGNLRELPTELQQSFLKTVLFDVNRTNPTDIYRELADLLLSQGRILEAQEVLELLKIQELRDFTRNSSAGGEQPDVALTQTEEQIINENGTLIAFGQKVVECEETSCSQLDGLLEQLDDLTEQFNQTLQAIETEVRDRIAQDPGTLDSEDFLREANDIVEAQPGTVLIYPLVLEDKIWLLWAAEGGIVKSVEVPSVGQRQLGETVLKFRQLLQNPRSDIAELQATGKQLYDWLIQPLEEELKSNGIQNLVFSLDRAARYIPMSALFDGEKYLIENYTISTVLSADLTDTDKRLPPGTENTSVLAMGLSEAVAGFNPLPNVPPELDAIVQTTENDPLGVYSGSQFLNQEFNLESLRKNLRGRQILHIATHGEFNPGRPEESYLVLGNGNKFAIPEISKLYRQLSDVHLVVLSACETALGGADADGNEINGISYYFLNHGAEAVMASLWLVNDASTSTLMQEFYGNLARGSETEAITKSQALRQAQLSLLYGDAASQNDGDERTVAVVEARPGAETASANSTASGLSHPYYWAPFILIGNGL